MTPTEPLPLYHSWPLCDLSQRFDLGQVLDGDRLLPGPASADAWRADRSRGHWACDLIDNRLEWTPQVHRLFGFEPDDGTPTRMATVALYAEASRAAMERLRAHAIRHRRGFTLDIEVFPIRGANRWLRLIAAPVSEDGRVVRLHGWKADVSALYRRRRS